MGAQEPQWAPDIVAAPVLANAEELPLIINRMIKNGGHIPIDFERWVSSGYQRTPTIVEAAFAARELSLSITWKGPGTEVGFQALTFHSWTFFFALAFALGLIALRLLRAVKERGEVRETISVQQLVAEEMIFIEAFFHGCVEAGQKDGSIADTHPADELAKLLLSVLLGIRVLARTRPQRDVLEGAANGVFALLGAVP